MAAALLVQQPAARTPRAVYWAIERAEAAAAAAANLVCRGRKWIWAFHGQQAGAETDGCRRDPRPCRWRVHGLRCCAAPERQLAAIIGEKRRLANAEIECMC